MTRLVVTSFQLEVGDIVRMHENELFPADLLLLSSSDKGQCYVDTSSVDGETNLKKRYSLQCTSSLSDIDQITSFSCEIECETRQESENKFEGTLAMENQKSYIGFFYYCLECKPLENDRN